MKQINYPSDVIPCLRQAGECCAEKNLFKGSLDSSDSLGMTQAERVQGFTLVETLIYLALFAIIIGGALVTTYQIIQSSQAMETKVALQEEGDFLLGKISWALSGVKTINSSTSGGKLSVAKYDSATPNPLIYDYNPDSQILFSNSTGNNLALNNNEIKIVNLTFNHLFLPEGIEAKFTLSSLSENGRSYTQDFSITEYIK